MLGWLTTPTVELDAGHVDAIRARYPTAYAVEVLPSTRSVEGVLSATMDALADRKTRFFGVGNASPVYAFEIIRAHPDSLHLQFVVPTKRAERVLRTHLTEDVPGVGFADGTLELPLVEGDTAGGALVYPGRDSWQPLRTEFDGAPTNAIVGVLHRHAMRNTRFVIQVVFQPIAGQPLRSWWWRRRAYQRLDYLNKETEQLWGSRNATRRQRGQAHAIEGKVANAAYRVGVRVLVLGAGEYTPARVKEVAAAFAAYRNPETDQYLASRTLRSLRRTGLASFVRAVASRRFGGWSYRFRCTPAELAGLTAVPTRTQQNLRRNTP